MMHRFKSRLSAWIAAASVAMAVCAMVVISAQAQTKEPPVKQTKRGPTPRA